ncbi:MAG: heavy metal-binding domain-containing protein, partial [Candidatus Binataceae bacterium]
MNKQTLMLLVVLAFVAGGAGWWVAESPHRHQLVKQVDPAGRVYYTCPMHPQVRLDVPGNCPICGMRLVPTGDTPTTAPTADVTPGAVRITPEKQQLIGVKIGQAEIASGVETIHAPGKVAYDETSV